jgi:fermentation-respiration switch protein FrsA (DUF1100 family)
MTGLLTRWLALLFFLPLLVGCPMKGLIFFPEKRIDATPADVGLAFEDLYLTASDGVQIHGWFVPVSGAQTTLLWFHGNAGNISHRVPLLLQLHQKIKANIFMVDYRGYGRSEGKVSEKGTYLDALASYDYLSTRAGADPARIVAFGQSLGAAVGVELATQRNLAGLILEAPFTSIKEMARAVYFLPLGGFISTRYDNLAKIKKIQTPLLILHGDQDEIVPYAQGRRLFEAANEPKRFYTIAGAGHNNTYRVGKEGYGEAIQKFVEEVQSF